MREMPPMGSAPTFTVPMREIVALEHPMIVKNIDKGLKTLGSGVPLQQLLGAHNYEGCFPLYLRTADPTCAPLLSNNTPSSNVLLKIVVPKRTGRKRKRGSDEPFMLDQPAIPPTELEESPRRHHITSLRSHSRLDSPKDILRSLRDNVNKYHIEPVGNIYQTHRYRAMTDFHYSTTHGPFMTKVRETILPGNVDSLKNFKLDPSRGVKENDEIIPPPTFSDKTIPTNWGYHQNSNIKVSTDQQTGETILTNHSRAIKINTFYVPFDTPTVPTSPPPLPSPDPILESVLVELRNALSERPIWTRRAIINRIPRFNPGVYLLKAAIQYEAYQFRGGPWRDAIVRYGVDPRTDPSYRIYQTIFFKILEFDGAPSNSLDGSNAGATNSVAKAWHDQRSEYTRKANAESLDRETHIFTGNSVSLDGKVWQVCDITDPLLARLLATPTLRETCDVRQDGWYCNGSWAKVRAVMRTKISAIRLGRPSLPDSVFQMTLSLPDDVKEKARVTAYLPNLGEGGVVRPPRRKHIGAGVEDKDKAGDNPNNEEIVNGAGTIEEGTEIRGFLDDGRRGSRRPNKAWRRKQSRLLSRRRHRKRLEGTPKNMGFGRQRLRPQLVNIGPGDTGGAAAPADTAEASLQSVVVGEGGSLMRLGRNTNTSESARSNMNVNVSVNEEAHLVLVGVQDEVNDDENEDVSDEDEDDEDDEDEDNEDDGEGDEDDDGGEDGEEEEEDDDDDDGEEEDGDRW